MVHAEGAELLPAFSAFPRELKEIGLPGRKPGNDDMEMN
jgi:hypothetical protein